MRPLDLKTKITAGVSVVVILSLSAAAYLFISYFEKQLKATIIRNQFLMLSVLENEIDKKLLHAQKQLIDAASEVPPEATGDPEKANAFLARKAYLTGFFDNHVGLFNASGVELSDFPVTPGRTRQQDFSYRSYFKRTVETERPVISEPYRSSHAPNHPAIMMTAPIHTRSGKFVGMLVGSLDLMGDNILGDVARIRIGRAGYLALTTADRIMIMNPDKDRIMRPITAGNRLYDAAVQGFEGTDETVTTGGTPMLASFKRMKVNDWILCAFYPQAEAYEAVADMKLYLLATSVAAVALIFLLLSSLLRRMTAPLALLTRHVAELPRKEGAAKLIHLQTQDEIGTLSRAFNTMVTELDQQHQALRESEGLFRTLTEQSVVGVYLIQDGLFRYVNPRFAQIFEYGIEEITNRLGPRDLSHAEDWPVMEEHLRRRVNGEVAAVHYHFRGVTKNNELRHVEVYGSATSYQGRPAIIGTLLDISDRKRAEAALRESEHRFRELADSLPQTVFETDTEGRFVYVNRAALETFRYTREDLECGISIREVIAPEDRERALANIQARMRGEREDHDEYAALRKDGSTFPVTVHAVPVIREGRLAGLRGILIDITDRKRLEAEVLRSQKLESIGVMAGGIAHDFNNILTAILGNISLAKTRVDRSDALFTRLSEAEKASLHARDLTQQLLTFARGGSPVKKTMDLEQIVRDAAGFSLRGGNVRAEFRFDRNLSSVEADAGQIGQVFNNLLINAQQAMPEGGTVVISAENYREKGGDYVLLRIEDTGIGIPPEHIDKVFDPYFTTKQKGSGLGLTIAYSVVKNHGGRIALDSAPGRGTTVSLHLPASAGARTAPVSAEARTNLTGTGRVLVMDDEDIVRRVIAAMLEELGYEPVVVSDGTEVIRRYREAQSEGKVFDAVIMDLTIPGGMGGRDAIRELLALDASVKAIVASGYSDDPVMSDFRSYGFSGVVRKPFQLSELAHTLQMVTQGSR